MNKKKIVYWTLGGLATAYVLFQVFRNLFKKEIPYSDEKTFNDSAFPLKKGDYNNDYVKSLQAHLNENFGEKLVVDGDFGAKTEEAVKRLQIPFETYKSVYPNAVLGQVDADYYITYVKNRF
jgi:peptidoglycan hydrolase-like protein with peptidoglycan-binding domain